MLTLGDEKMSKSVGNIITLRDLLARHGGEVLRYALLSGNYRSPLAWSDDLLKQAQASLDRMYQALLEIPPGNATHPEQFKHAPIEAFPPAVVEALGRRSQHHRSAGRDARHRQRHAPRQRSCQVARVARPADCRCVADGLADRRPGSTFQIGERPSTRRTSKNGSRRATRRGRQRTSNSPMRFGTSCWRRALSSRTRATVRAGGPALTATSGSSRTHRGMKQTHPATQQTSFSALPALAILPTRSGAEDARRRSLRSDAHHPWIIGKSVRSDTEQFRCCPRNGKSAMRVLRHCLQRWEGDPLAVCACRRPRRARRPARTGRARSLDVREIDMSPGVRRLIEDSFMFTSRCPQRARPLACVCCIVAFVVRWPAPRTPHPRTNHGARNAHAQHPSNIAPAPVEIIDQYAQSTNVSPAFRPICCAARPASQSANPAASAASPKSDSAAPKPTNCW